VCLCVCVVCVCVWCVVCVSVHNEVIDRYIFITPSDPPPQRGGGSLLPTQTSITLGLASFEAVPFVCPPICECYKQSWNKASLPWLDAFCAKKTDFISFGFNLILSVDADSQLFNNWLDQYEFDALERKKALRNCLRSCSCKEIQISCNTDLLLNLRSLLFSHWHVCVKCV
jgi:hypothetical protein